MLSHDGRFVVVFNGEIYNFAELRERMEGLRGAISWRGHSDTEVLLEAFSQWGVNKATEHVVGMFAYAVLDRQEKVLHLGRDRLGEKPLYYGWAGDCFIFASELKAIRKVPGWRNSIDRNSLALYLHYSYVPAPYSIYEGIYKLTPGTILSLPLELLAVHVGEHALGAIAGLSPVEYWSIERVVQLGHDNPWQGTKEEAVTELDQLLRNAAKLQMVADVPVGAFLSGGVDSSSIVAAMQLASGRPAKTFTIGFVEQGYDEARFARKIARHLKSDHTELYVGYDDAIDLIPDLPRLYDEPFSDSSQIPTYFLAKLARQTVTVSLSGDGGDELFGGYNRHVLANAIWRKIKWMPKFARHGLALGIEAISPQRWDSIVSTIVSALPDRMRVSQPGDRAHKLAELLEAQDAEDAYRNFVSHWKVPSQIVVGSTEPVPVLGDPKRWAAIPEFEHRMMYLDTVSYLSDDILVKVDRAAMSVSLETRMPFLDHRIVEFAWRLPLAMKLHKGQGKWILRRVLDKYVPRELVDRPKMGFGVPIDSWLRGPLRNWAESLLDEARLRREGYLIPGPIRQKWTEHLSGTRNWQFYLWDILMFQSWLENQQSPSSA